MDNLQNVIIKAVINNRKLFKHIFVVHIYGLTRRSTSSSLGMCYMSLLISQYTAAKSFKIDKTPTFKIKTLCT